MESGSAPRVERWERATSIPLLIAALAFLAAYAIPVIWPSLSHWGFEVVVWATWAIFAADYAIRVWLAEDRWAFLRVHLLDLIVVALPLLRPLRMLRVVTVLTALNRRASSHLRGRVVTYMSVACILLGFCAAVTVLEAERGHPDSNIATFEDAVWWAMATMTTVGYGDRSPVTTTGRIVGIGLMIGGIAVLGTVTATIASWLVERVGGENEIERLQVQVGELQVENAALRAELSAFRRLAQAPTGQRENVTPAPPPVS